MVRQWSLQFEKDITFDKIKTVLKKTTPVLGFKQFLNY
jgi:hypothetical protein